MFITSSSIHPYLRLHRQKRAFFPCANFISILLLSISCAVLLIRPANAIPFGGNLTLAPTSIRTQALDNPFISIRPSAPKRFDYYLNVNVDVSPRPDAYFPEFGDLSYPISYYGLVDPQGRRQTLTEWQAENGFSDPSNTVISAEYINGVDLGFGREMFCLNKKHAPCYVKNYKNPQDEATFLGTVAMERIKRNGETIVAFFVYDPDGKRVNQIALDSEGAKAVPQACYACHGGSNNSDNFTRSYYLPWDIELLEDWQGRATVRSQAESFRQFNRIALKDAMLSGKTAIKTLIKSWYGGIPIAGKTFNRAEYKTVGEKVIPRDRSKKNWFDDPKGYLIKPDPVTGTLTIVNPKAYKRYYRERSLYSNVYVKYCRSCHVAQNLDWQKAIDFNNDAFSQICVADPQLGVNKGYRKIPIMPHAELTDNLFTNNIVNFTNGHSSTALQTLCSEFPPVENASNQAAIAAGQALIADRGCTGSCHTLDRIACSSRVRQNLGLINPSMNGLTLTANEVVQISSYLNSLDSCPVVDTGATPPTPPKLRPKPEPEPEPLPPTFTSMLKVKHSGKCLDINGESMMTGARAIQYRCESSYENQSFTFLPVAGKDKTYRIKAKHSHLCLAVAGNSQERATQVVQNDCDNSKLNQQFILNVVNITSRLFDIRAVHSGQCLDVFGESQADAANVIQWPCENAENQQWTLEGFIP